MKEPEGMMERLRARRPSALDIAYVDHRLSATINATELKLLRQLKIRIAAASTPDGTNSDGAMNKTARK